MRSVRLGKIGKIACLVMLVCFFSISTASAGWYEASLVKITPRSDSGDVFIQIESAFSPPQWSGIAKGIVDASDPGFNAMMATLLTALSLGYNVTVETAAVPSWDTPQVITACSVVAP